ELQARLAAAVFEHARDILASTGSASVGFHLHRAPSRLEIAIIGGEGEAGSAIAASETGAASETPRTELLGGQLAIESEDGGSRIFISAALPRRAAGIGRVLSSD